MHQIDPESETITSSNNSLYPYVNNDIEYGLFEDIVDSYYLDSQIKDDFQCDHDCYSHQQDLTVDDHSNICTHRYHQIVQTIHSFEENASLFTDDTATPCDFSIMDQHSVTEKVNDTNIPCVPKQSGIHSQQKHAYRNTFGESNIQYHDFDNQDSLTFTQHCYNKNYKIHTGIYMTQ